MKKLLAVLILGIFAIAGIAIASTVTTTDGKNFNVTNDVGVSSSMTNAQIMGDIFNSNRMVSGDTQKLMFDSETLAIWSSVEQMAQQAVANMQTNSVTTNTAS